MNRLARVVFRMGVIGLLATCPATVFSQSTPGTTSQKPSSKMPAPTPAETAGPQQTKHYPILVVAHGNEPFWGLRLGMKGPERLDRANYPPIVLDPLDVVRDESGILWTYHAKDSQTGAAVSVKLTREPCSDGMSDTRYVFKVVVDHAQIGTLNGCGVSSPEKFPEFRKKNQLDPSEEPDPATKDRDKDRNPALEPITKFASPVAIAYLLAAGRIEVSVGALKKIASPSGYELSLSHDGKKLLFTKDLAGKDRAIVLYDLTTGRSQDLATGLVHQSFWSPDDSRIAFLKFVDDQWQVWSFPVSAPDKAAQFSPQAVVALDGWVSPTTVLASDMENLYWLGEDGKAQQTVALKQIYGETYQRMSSDTIRSNPVNPDLLLVSAFYSSAPPGSPEDSMGLNSSFFLYEIRSKRRVSLCPTDTWARSAEWSRDGIQIYFTRMSAGKTFTTDRLFWDGTGLKRYIAGNSMVIGN